MYSVTPSNLNNKPANRPINTVAPASYKYLCPLFFRNPPNIAASINKNSIRRISIDALP